MRQKTSSDITDYIPRLRRYARALTGEQFAADDLVQDTLERALSRFTLFRRDSKLDAWLLSIMHNVFVNQIRSKPGRGQEDSLDDEQFTLARENAAHNTLPPMRATQEDGLAIRDLDRALAMLSPEQREVLLLVSLEECSYEDTAQILGIPLGTVMSRLFRAREHLRVLLTTPAPASVAHAHHLKVIK